MDGRVIGLGDPAAQMRQCLANIETSLHELGADMTDVVRTRIYVVDIGAWASIGRVHEETFRDIRPATSMVEVNRLISPDILVEVEADACIDV
jgi:enamine deaminase RidA (YjgF/YER057c/UK114 family)